MSESRSQPSSTPPDEDPLAQEFDDWVEHLDDAAATPRDAAPAERATGRLNAAPNPRDELRRRLARLIADKEQHFSMWEGYLPPAQQAAWKQELEELRVLQVLARRLD